MVLLALLPLLPLGRYLLPLVAPAPIYPDFVRALQSQHLGRAVGMVLLWAFVFSASLVIVARWNYPAFELGVLNASNYRSEMFVWIETGFGREGDWRQFLPQHLMHLVIFLLVARVFGGYAALCLGSYLVAYMSIFVAAVSLASHRPVLGAVVSWFPWAICRVVGFVALGTVLARWRRVKSSERYTAGERSWLVVGASGILLDWLLKATLAERYRVLLQGWIAGSSP